MSLLRHGDGDDADLSAPGRSPLLEATSGTASPNLGAGLGITASDRSRLLEPYDYLTRVPGKGVRPRLIDAFNAWLDIPLDKLSVVKEVVQELHTASLLVDDIEDNSRMRRGVPAAHLVYGVPSCINGANYVYFLAMRRGLELGGEAVVRILVDELVALHEGQGLDIAWRDSNQCPTEAQYRDMVVNKTGGLFRLAVRLMGQFSECETDFTPLVTALGLWFQVQDDYQNLRSAQYHRNKSFCEDITEGKFSFPTVHHIHSVEGKGDRRVINILKQRTEDPELKRYAVRCLEETGSFEYTLEVLRRLEDDIAAQIRAFGGNPALEAIIQRIASARAESDSDCMAGGATGGSDDGADTVQ